LIRCEEDHKTDQSPSNRKNTQKIVLYLFNRYIVVKKINMNFSEDTIWKVWSKGFLIVTIHSCGDTMNVALGFSGGLWKNGFRIRIGH
jgi:hypothetical protein